MQRGGSMWAVICQLEVGWNGQQCLEIGVSYPGVTVVCRVSALHMEFPFTCATPDGLVVFWKSGVLLLVSKIFHWGFFLESLIFLSGHLLWYIGLTGISWWKLTTPTCFRKEIESLQLLLIAASHFESSALL